MDSQKFMQMLGSQEELFSYQKKIAEQIESHNLPVIIFGAAKLAEKVTETLKKFGVKVSGYAVDGKYFKPNKTYLGLPIFNFDELRNTPSNYVFVLGFGGNTFKAKKDALLNDQNLFVYEYMIETLDYITYDYVLTNKEKFVETYNLLSDDLSKEIAISYLKTHITQNCADISGYFDPNQYFNDLTRFIIQDGGIGYVDCGAYIGDTLKDFVNFVNNDYRKIFAVEPDKKNFIELQKLISEKNYRNVEIFNCGVWDKKDTLHFITNSQNGGGSKISESGETSINVDSVDNLIGDNEINFIKMDIEGSELKALEGSVNTIKNFKPLLAICVYHRKEDLITIPQFIKKTYSEYNFYLRHHSNNLVDLVLYAIPK